MEHAANITGFDRWLEKITDAADGPMSARHVLEASRIHVCICLMCVSSRAAAARASPSETRTHTQACVEMGDWYARPQIRG